MLGKRIRDRRLELNMTQDELAQKTGYKTKGAISRIENGERDLSQSQISDFAKALKTTESFLMGWEDEKQDTNASFKEMVAMGFDGLDVSKMSDEERENYYNDLIDMMNMVTLKYKNKGNK